MTHEHSKIVDSVTHDKDGYLISAHPDGKEIVD